MSTYYQGLDQPGGLNYELYRIPSLGSMTFRGPPVDLASPYLAFIGAAQTFGRFAAAPFPTLLGARLGIQVLNLGAGGAGPRYFERHEFIELLNGAEAVVIQVLSGRSASNSLFDNSESGGMIGRLHSDQSTVRADEFFSQLSLSATQTEIENIVVETRDDYVSGFTTLLRKLKTPKILFWLSTRHPEYRDDYTGLPYSIFKSFPQLVNGEMVETLAAFSDAYVECVSSVGLPQTLWPSDRSIDGAVSNAGVLENNYYPSPAMHVEAADALEGACRRFLGSYGPQPLDKAARRFVIVAAARTGTNLLIGLLNDYEGCYVGNELFNPTNISGDIIPWRDVDEADRPALLKLRQSDPIAFWDDLCRRSERAGSQTIGFKLLYAHGLSQKDLLNRLVADETIPIIHLTRRNLLRRIVSERQAYATGKWAAGAAAPAEARPAVTISINDIVTSIRTIEEQQVTFDAMFAHHPVLKVFYEDLAERPLAVAQRAARFLELPAPVKPPTIKHKKTGAEDLSEALVDFAALRAKLRHWSAQFDD